MRGSGNVVSREDNTVEIPAGLTWQQVENQLSESNRQMQVLPDYLGLSVGGTLSVGCYGADSLHGGAQVTSVEGIQIVLPGGTECWCSDQEHPDVFHAALAGVGRFGVVQRVVMSTVERKPWTAFHSYRADNLSELADIAIDLCDQPHPPDLFKTLYANGRFAATCGSYHQNAASALRHQSPLQRPVFLRWLAPRYRTWRSLAVQLWLGRYRGYQKLWADYLLDGTGLRAFSRHLDTALARQTFGSSLKAVYMLPVRRPDRNFGALEGSSRLHGSMAYGIGLYNMVSSTDSRELARTQAALGEALACVIDAGGKPYLYGAHDLSSYSLSTIYGATWTHLESLKRELDPDCLFGNPLQR